MDAKFRSVGFEDLVDSIGHVRAARFCVQLRTVVCGVYSRNCHMNVFIYGIEVTKIFMSGFSWPFNQVESEERLAR